MKLKPIADVQGALHGYSFFCPGCGHAHAYFTTGEKTWSFDGNTEVPSFNPSLKLECPDHGDPKQRLCHLNLVAGKLHYDRQCTHDLAGQVVDLPDYPY